MWGHNVISKVVKELSVMVPKEKVKIRQLLKLWVSELIHVKILNYKEVL